MSAVFGRHCALLGTLTCALFAALPAQADSLTINLDQARLLKIPERTTTVVIGNPLIADATLQGGGLMVVTGKGYGATNLLALDRDGRVVMSKTVEVHGPAPDNVVTVYRGIIRETWNCAPECQPRNTLGDGAPYFGDTLAQITARNGAAQGGAAAPAAGPPGGR
ncbi:MAG TPA: pilus assembly protein N-terminal domain-containing protein [Pseudolabrys sp.]|nr:pilus assembly protein N-terminal domain-containing protein [Pseudolabrys sp.]